MTKRGIPKPKAKIAIRKTTRISYKEVDGFVESSPVLLGSELVLIQIDRNTNIFRILDIKTKRLCFSLGQGSSVVNAKKLARDRLIDNRASILDEVRVRK